MFVILEKHTLTTMTIFTYFIMNLVLHEAGEVLVSLAAVPALVWSVRDSTQPGALVGQCLGVQERAGGLVTLHEAEHKV